MVIRFLTILGICPTLALMAPAQAAGQAAGLPTGTPPFRTSSTSELSLMFTTPRGAAWGGDMAYSFAAGPFDLGGRFAVLGYDTPADPGIYGEVQARLKASAPTRDYPVDGAVTASVGIGSPPGGERFGAVSAGYTMGRRLDVSPDVAVVPYAGPTFIVRTIAADRVGFMFGIGTDVWVGPRFSTRLAVSLGTVQGFTLGFVWRQ